MSENELPKPFDYQEPVELNVQNLIQPTYPYHEAPDKVSLYGYDPSVFQQDPAGLGMFQRPFSPLPSVQSVEPVFHHQNANYNCPTPTQVGSSQNLQNDVVPTVPIFVEPSPVQVLEHSQQDHESAIWTVPVSSDSGDCETQADNAKPDIADDWVIRDDIAEISSDDDFKAWWWNKEEQEQEQYPIDNQSMDCTCCYIFGCWLCFASGLCYACCC